MSYLFLTVLGDSATINQGATMKPLNRRPVRKGKSVKNFKHHVRKTKAANLARPMRGGIRM